MSGLAFALVLTAALLHALWNAIVKGAGDRALVLAGISLAHGATGAVMVLMFPLPAAASWPFIIASTLVHYGYYAFLFLAYRFGDLSQVYPVARGIAPVLVALGAEAAAGEALSWQAWAALIAVSSGIAVLAFPRGLAAANPRAVGAALATGVLIAAYSVIDGIGVRLSASPFGYMAWLFVLDLPVAVFVGLRRRGVPAAALWPALRAGFLGGLLATTAYGLVIYAKTFALLAAVSAVRESGVVFAALIGVIRFGERPWRRRVIAAAIVGAGLIALAVLAGGPG